MVEQKRTKTVKGHGKWSAQDIPHRGWVLIRRSSNPTKSFKCEMCERNRIKHVFHMVHSDYKVELRVGVTCSKHMSIGYVRQKNRPDKNKAIRYSPHRRKWNTSIKGNEFLNIAGFNLTIIPERGKSGDRTWGCRVTKIQGGGYQYYGGLPNNKAAKVKAFEVLNDYLTL